jgi:hypothetical protein
MFIVKPNNPAEWQSAMFILSYYQVSLTVRSDGDNMDSAYMAVDPLAFCASSTDKERQEHYRLAEIAFMANWHQKHGICADCKDPEPCLKCEIYSECAEPGNVKCTGISHHCGHMTFTGLIIPAF